MPGSLTWLKSQWTKVMNAVAALYALPSKLQDLRMRYSRVYQSANRAQNRQLMDLSEQGVIRTDKLRQRANEAVTKLESYRPAWRDVELDAAASESPLRPSGLAALPVMIATIAIAGGVFVLGYGMKLLYDATNEERLLRSVEAKLITVGQARALRPPTAGLFPGFGFGSVGIGLLVVGGFMLFGGGRR